MAKRKSISTGVVLFIWAYNQQRLDIAIGSNSYYHSYNVKISDIARDLLPLIERHLVDQLALTGIGIVRTALGSFSSSRLVLVTMNFFAWLYNVPVIDVDPNVQYNAQARSALITRVLKSSSSYDKQLVPMYIAPLGITKSKRKSKFTILHG